MQRTRFKRTRKKGRRYPKGHYPIYDTAFKIAKNKSPLFNPNARNLYNTHPINNPQAGIFELKGMPGKDGHYKHGDEWTMAAIPHYQRELALLKKRFKAWQRKQVETGECLSPPKSWPPTLLDLRLKNEAILDVRKLELKELEATLERKEKAKQKKKKEEMLKHGPLTTGFPRSLTDKERREWDEIDGQQISRNAEGIPFISSEGSPYFGMPFYWYFRMAKAWKKEMGLDNESLFKERDKMFKESQKQAIQNKQTLPSKRITIKKLRKEKLVSITEDDFPEWPKDAKPINEIEAA